ncbi:MAG: phospho-sugar mutase [Halioglobus sp.]
MNTIVQDWLARDPDPLTRKELQTLVDAGNKDELALRFGARLAFGTAGLRGVVGAGPGMMNRLVIRETSAGLGSYLLDNVVNAAGRGVVVAYDGRLDSRQFARDAACVFAGLGITAYLTPDVAATPVAAFGVIEMGTAAGVVVTASHNPPQYNGYKVYWENGAQIIPPHDVGIAAAIDVAAQEDIPWMDFEEGRAAGKIVVLGPEFYRSYINTIQASHLHRTAPGSHNTSVAYTAMHGVGAEIAETLLREAGFEAVYSVASQREPDGNFPTVNFPNPEEPGAMDAVVALAQSHGATLACANDPDADRLAVAVRTPTGDYQMLTGDMLGVLLANYLLEKDLDFVPIVCTTIVSSSLLGRIAEAAGAQYFTTLTGFKWLANVALAQEDENGNHQFLFAYEEALGYATGRQVRDKDGLSALLAFVQMTEALAIQGLSVLDKLEEIYRRHGIYLTGQRSIALQPGAASIGELLRESPPEAIADSAVLSVDDLSAGHRRYSDGRTEPLDFPASDVLIYRLANQARVIVRPSGTEPKVKCYYEVVEAVGEGGFSNAKQRAEEALAGLISQHQNAIAQLTG